MEAQEIFGGSGQLSAKVLDAVPPARPVELGVVGGGASLADRFEARLETSRNDGGVLLGGTRKTLLLGELRHLIGLGGAGYVEQPRGLLGTDGARPARPEGRPPRLPP